MGKGVGSPGVLFPRFLQRHAVAERTWLHLVDLQFRRLGVGIIERIANQHRHPAREHLRAPVALDQRVLAGHERAEELRRLGKADRVRLRHRPQRRHRAVFQQVRCTTASTSDCAATPPPSWPGARPRRPARICSNRHNGPANTSRNKRRSRGTNRANNSGLSSSITDILPSFLSNFAISRIDSS